MVACDGTSNPLVLATECIIPITELRALPLNLDWGQIIKVKITSTNEQGENQPSLLGGTAVILTFPDEPISLIDDAL